MTTWAWPGWANESLPTCVGVVCNVVTRVVAFCPKSLSTTQSVRLWRVAIGSVLLISLFGVVLWRGGFPVLPSRSALSKVSPFSLAWYVACWLCILLIRSVRWRFLLRPLAPVPWWHVIRVSLIGFGALGLLPLRLGEAVRPTMIRRSNQIGWWEAVGTVGAERILDGLFLSSTLAFSLYSTQWLSPLPDHIGNLPVPVAFVPVATTVALSTFATLFICLGLFYWSREFTQRLISRTVGVVSHRAAAWLTSAIARTAAGLTFLPMWRYLVPFFALTGMYWLLNAASLMLLMRACGLTNATLGQAWVSMGVLGLGVVVPNAPGFFGAFQLSLFAGLALYFRTDEVISSGAVFVFYAYVVQIFVTIFMAFCAWIAQSLYGAKPEVAAEPG